MLPPTRAKIIRGYAVKTTEAIAVMPEWHNQAMERRGIKTLR
jgi:hypothetical protein